MKLYNLFVATFFVLVKFSDEAAVNKNAELKAYIYSSYEDNLKKLKTNGLEYLVKDLDQLYEMGYEMASTYWDFYENNQDLMDRLESAKDSALWCMNENLNDAINHHNNVVEELSNSLKEVPKNPSCYEDLITYYEDIKKPSMERLAKDETFVEVENFKLKTNELLKKFDMMTTDVPDAMKKLVEIVVDDYVQKMVDNVESKTEAEVQRQSEDSVGTFKERVDGYVEFLRKERVLNKDVVEKIIQEYREVQDTCQEKSRSLYSSTGMTQSFTLGDIATIEKYASAKFYIIDEENNQKPLDCKDHVPYFGASPTETVLSFSMNNDKISFLVTGIDNNGRGYKRTYNSENVNDKETMVREIIQYNDEVVDRKYLVEFETGM